MAVLGLAAFLITGYVAPGFLNHNSPDADAQQPAHVPVPQSTPPLPTQDPNEFVTGVLKQLDGGHVKPALRKYCHPPRDLRDDELESAAHGGAKLRTTETLQASDVIPISDIAGTVNGHEIDSVSNVQLGHRQSRNPAWCIRELAVSLPDVTVKDAQSDAEKLAADINGRDLQALLKKS
ncbi:MAG: hypothetical protein J2P17_29470, partial [Mycobacterium sp.]|nr:hypothetical protein [Mycobacterium sp.]